MNIRSIDETDYAPIIAVLDDWWGGRSMTHLLPRLFFQHFQNTSFVLEEDGQAVAFLIGFVSQTHPEVAYIHFLGVHPGFRKRGVARQLYETFFARVCDLGCRTVQCITSPINEGSVSFHAQMGFGASVAADYAGPGQDRVLFSRSLIE